VKKKLQHENTLSEKTLKFLIKANKQKNPEWLEKNQDEYESVVKTPFIQLAENIKFALQPLARDYHFPSKGLARIKRAAFKVSPGEPIFKDWLSMMATKPAKSRFESNPHLFFGLFPNETAKILVAGGLWLPTSRQSRLVREAIAQDSEAFHQLFKNKKFKTRFRDGFWMEEQAKKIPVGFAADHPDIEWIKLKKFVVMKEYSVKDLSKKTFHGEVIADFEQALLFNRLLEKALNAKFDLL